MTDRTAVALASALPERVECKGEYKWTAQDGKLLYSTERYLSRDEIAGWILARLALNGWRLIYAECAGFGNHTLNIRGFCDVCGIDLRPPQTFAEHTAEALALIHDHVEASDED